MGDACNPCGRRRRGMAAAFLTATFAIPALLAYIDKAERRLRRIWVRLPLCPTNLLHDAGMSHLGSCPSRMGQRIPK
jgi:hypothetical protein